MFFYCILQQLYRSGLHVSLIIVFTTWPELRFSSICLFWFSANFFSWYRHFFFRHFIYICIHFALIAPLMKTMHLRNSSVTRLIDVKIVTDFMTAMAFQWIYMKCSSFGNPSRFTYTVVNRRWFWWEIVLTFHCVCVDHKRNVLFESRVHDRQS